jgi:hypothetical protein
VNTRWRWPLRRTPLPEQRLDLRHPLRDAVALAAAYRDDDAERGAALLEPYELDPAGRELILSLLDLVTRGRDPDEVSGLLDGLALAGAGQPHDLEEGG